MKASFSSQKSFGSDSFFRSKDIAKTQTVLLTQVADLFLPSNLNIDQRRSLAPKFPMWVTIQPACALFEGVPYRCLPVIIAVQILSL